MVDDISVRLSLDFTGQDRGRGSTTPRSQWQCCLKQGWQDWERRRCFCKFDLCFPSLPDRVSAFPQLSKSIQPQSSIEYSCIQQVQSFVLHGIIVEKYSSKGPNANNFSTNVDDEFSCNFMQVLSLMYTFRTNTNSSNAESAKGKGSILSIIGTPFDDVGIHFCDLLLHCQGAQSKAPRAFPLSKSKFRESRIEFCS